MPESLVDKRLRYIERQRQLHKERVNVVFEGRAPEGTGAEKGTTAETCITCQGSGQTRYQQGFFSVMRTCSNCRGRGQLIRTPCKVCRGAGRVEKEKTLEIKIPAGVETGSRLRVSGEGEAGPNGGPSGDLFVVIHVKEHDVFERQGANLYSAVPITFAQAALGAEIKVRTLDGEEDLKIPAGTQTGTVFRIKSQGMPALGGRGRGDLFVAVTLITPKTLTKEQRKLLEHHRLDQRVAGQLRQFREHPHHLRRGVSELA